MRLDLDAVRGAYASGDTPASLLARVYDALEVAPLRPVWITLVPRADVLARAQALHDRGRADLPLYGVPFAVKDNMDVAGLPTTAACPAYSYVPDITAATVQRLEDAGAVLVGKTNMDQFATGLVGTRSPYGACASAFSDASIAGGSSSGSALAVAQGLVSFALGTDTAGSGRVPAALGNIVGLKPTRGSLSTRGIVPACRTLDCVSVFALTCGDARDVLMAARGFDPADPYSQLEAAQDAPAPWLAGAFSFGVLPPDQREFFGDGEAARLYALSIKGLEHAGGTPREFDFRPFREAAALLYAGPWVAERLAVLGGFFAAHPNDVHPVVRGIVEGGARFSAADAFQAQYRLEALRRETQSTWDACDLLLLPTTGTTYTLEDVSRDPVALNSNLGYYTNFVNLLDLAAVAVPAGQRADGLPLGVSLVGPARTDLALLAVSDRLHRGLDNATVGGLSTSLADTPPLAAPSPPPGCTLLAVVGAHLAGQPLNFQLTERGARLAFAATTDPAYRLYALSGTVPAKPGLVRAPGFMGPGIAVEVWAMPTAHLGSFVAAIPAPLGIGTVTLDSGRQVNGFLCEPFAVDGAQEITALGGWRVYLASRLPVSG